MNTSRSVIAWALLASACSGTNPSEENTAELTLALDDPAAVLGFENSAFWTASAGTKSSSTTHTQGVNSLGIADFTYAELTSSALSNLSGVTGTVAFDIRPPVSPAWGQVQLFASIPSLNIYNAYFGQVSLVGSTAGAFRSVSFSVPSNVLSALGQAYADLRFKIAINVPQTSQPYLLDNVHFVGTSQASVVTLNVSGVDDFVYVTVNGIRRKVVPINQSVSNLDISSWFRGGANSLRLQAVNTGGPASYSAQVLVNGSVVVDATCANAPCNPATPPGTGILFDQTYSISTPNRPAASTLTVNGTAGGKIYLNDAFTGLTVPGSFTLPQGSYTVGLGVGEGTTGAYQGQYHEQTVTLGASALTVTPSQTPPLALPNHTRIALLPIRQAIHGSGGPTNTGILSNSDITVMHGNILATRDAWVKPFSYGTTTWDVDLLSTVENTPIYRGPDPLDVPDAGRFLQEAGLTSLEQTYDIIVYFMSKFTASGAVVANDPCCFWGGGQLIAFPNHLTRSPDWPATRPNVYFLHESLHDYESYNDGRLHFYNGADGLHGGEEHGYFGGDGGEEDFLQYMRRFMRNQLAELNTMRGGVAFNQTPPTNADLWVGVFDTMRRDVNWQSTGLTASSLLATAARKAKTATSTEALCALPAPKVR
jgi:hypothetical protein